MRQNLLKILNSQQTNLAFCIQNNFYSYKNLKTCIVKIYSVLKSQKIKNNFVPVITNNCIETYATIIALWFLGKAYVPISASYPKDRIEEILDQIESDVLICTLKEDEKFEFENIEKLQVFNLKEENNLTLEIKNIDENENLCMLFTSGSTGKPKGVPYTLKNINSTLNSFWHLNFNLKSSDKFLQMFELTFDMSLLSFLPALLLGASVFTIDNKKIKYVELIKTITKHKISVATLVPSTLNYLKPYFNKLNFESLNYSFFGGEPLKKSIIKQYKKVAQNSKIVNLSGPCETTMACVSYELNQNLDENRTINDVFAFGKVWKNTTAIIVDENNNEVKNRVAGELCFAGENVMQGYFKNEDLNKKVFFYKEIAGKKMRFYKSGDISFKDDENIFYSCGRKDNQYKIQGFKVELGEIESLVFNNFKVNYCAAVAIENANNIFEIYLVIDNLNLKTKNILDFLKTKLPAYSLPKRIFTFIKMPVNLNGKLNRRKLTEMIKKELENID